MLILWLAKHFIEFLGLLSSQDVLPFVIGRQRGNGKSGKQCRIFFCFTHLLLVILDVRFMEQVLDSLQRLLQEGRSWIALAVCHCSYWLLLLRQWRYACLLVVLIVIHEKVGDLDRRLFVLVIFVYGIHKTEVNGFLSRHPITFVHLSCTLFFRLSGLVSVHLCQYVVEGGKVIFLLGEILDIGIKIILILLRVGVNHRARIMNKEERTFDDVDGLAAQHGNGRNGSVHAKGMGVDIAMVFERLVEFQSVLDIAAIGAEADMHLLAFVLVKDILHIVEGNGVPPTAYSARYRYLIFHYLFFFRKVNI